MNRPLPEKLADIACTVLLIAACLYFSSHVLAAWLCGSFEVTR